MTREESKIVWGFALATIIMAGLYVCCGPRPATQPGAIEHEEAIAEILAPVMRATPHAQEWWLPNPKNVPGAIEPKVTVKQLSDPDFIKEDRHVSAALKQIVFARDGISWEKRANYEVDHLIPKCLAGADVLTNLWCQPWDGEWGAHKKDQVEVKMHRLVQAGQLDLKQAQKEIAANWVECFKRYCEPEK